MKRTECRQGHDMTDPANTYSNLDGYRRCRECRRLEVNKRMAGRKRPVVVKPPKWPTVPMGRVRPIPALPGVEAAAACTEHVDVFDSNDKWLKARICEACPLAQWCEQRVTA